MPPQNSLPFLHYRVEKEPDMPSGNRLREILGLVIQNGSVVSEALKSLENPEYLYWDKAKYRPVPEGLKNNELWFLEKLRRRSQLTNTLTPINDFNDKPFVWIMLDQFQSTLHELDMNFGGNLRISEPEIDSRRRFYVSRGVREEAIASSQLEGASTTRAYAKRMLREKRVPRNRDDQMILNNYRVMLDIEERMARGPLSLADLIEMQSRLTEKTLREQDQVGRLREDSDEVIVEDRRSQTILHQPPPRNVLDKELDRLIVYANSEDKNSVPVHPAIKAILLHFWIGYLHPFADGNGRVARAIFYWYLLRRNYWAVSYLSISSFIRKSPVQYRDAYLYSEQDSNDLTYFIDYNLRKISQAIQQFAAFQERAIRLNGEISRHVKQAEHMNDRQIELVRYFGQNASARTTVKIHAEYHGVTRLTAASDLKGLESTGYLVQLRDGRERPYEATNKLKAMWDRLQFDDRKARVEK